jgi:hypothetical protein
VKLDTWSGLVLSLVLAAGAAHAEAGAGGTECTAVFSKAAADQVFARVRAQAGADGCILEDLHTERSRMEIVWKKADLGILPAMVLEPAPCAPERAQRGQTLVLTVPPEVPLACPDAWAAAIAAEHALEPTSVSLEKTFSRSAAEWAWALVGLLLIGAGAVAIHGLRRGATTEAETRARP